MEGIGLDGVIDAEEEEELRRWIEEHAGAHHRHPSVHDAIAAIERALSDGVVTLDEIADIREVCGRRQDAARYYDDATHTMQRLHGLPATAEHGPARRIRAGRCSRSGCRGDC